MSETPIRVLVADDDALVREMVGASLRENGFAVETACNGAEAVVKRRQDPHLDLILSDMNMPELDGLGMIRRLRADGDDIPIIILTGNNQISVAIQAINSGANDYLLKDENIQDTAALSVRKAIEKRQLQMQNARLMRELAKENERLEREKALAQKVQTSILPRGLFFPGLDVACRYQPSDKIGGDFFDAWEAAGRVHFLVGDVSGHSTSSALVMAVCKGLFRSLGQAQSDPPQIVAAGNRMLCEMLQGSGMFLSLFYGVFDRAAAGVAAVSAGHNPVFLCRPDGADLIESTGPALGWDSDDSWDTIRVPFPAGSWLVLYTDGLTEAKSAAGEDFGEGRLLAAARCSQEAAPMAERIFAEAGRHCAGRFLDDSTILILRRTA